VDQEGEDGDCGVVLKRAFPAWSTTTHNPNEGQDTELGVCPASTRNIEKFRVLAAAPLTLAPRPPSETKSAIRQRIAENPGARQNADVFGCT
jgi:hypothetical protein